MNRRQKRIRRERRERREREQGRPAAIGQNQWRAMETRRSDMCRICWCSIGTLRCACGSCYVCAPCMTRHIRDSRAAGPVLPRCFDCAEIFPQSSWLGLSDEEKQAWYSDSKPTPLFWRLWYTTSCPGCSHSVERASGCLHMICRCGVSFCFSCGGRMPGVRCAGYMCVRPHIRLLKFIAGAVVELTQKITGT